MSSTQHQIFVIERVFDILQFDMLQKFFTCTYHVTMSLTIRIIKPYTHWAFTCSKVAIEALEQGVKSVQI